MSNIWWRSVICLNIVANAHGINDPLHLKSTKCLRSVRNRYDDILWGKGVGIVMAMGKIVIVPLIAKWIVPL
jgi:hypothetical protein